MNCHTWARLILKCQRGPNPNLWKYIAALRYVDRLVIWALSYIWFQNQGFLPYFLQLSFVFNLLGFLSRFHLLRMSLIYFLISLVVIKDVLYSYNEIRWYHTNDSLYLKKSLRAMIGCHWYFFVKNNIHSYIWSWCMYKIDLISIWIFIQGCKFLSYI